MGKDSRISTKIIFLKLKKYHIYKKPPQCGGFFVNEIVGLKLLNLCLFHNHIHTHNYTCRYSYSDICSYNDNHNHS